MVEFRHDPKTGRSLLMEVNGRYWGSLALALQAGIDFPRYEWELAHGIEPSIPAHYPVGTRSRWMRGDMGRLWSVLTAQRDPGYPKSRAQHTAEFVADFNRRTRSALWSWRDPLPALLDGFGAWANLTQKVFVALAKRVLPRPVHRLFSTTTPLTGSERRAYTRLWFVRALRIREDRRRLAAAPVRNVVFVCNGNIIRSPMSEAALRRRWSMGKANGLTILSTGLVAQAGKPADPRARTAAAELGISLDGHVAQPLSEAMLRDADAIFVMDYAQEAKLVARYPWTAAKVFILGAFASSAIDPEIPDPDRGTIEDVRRCYRRLLACIDGAASVIETAPASAMETHR
jgi:protein-tyrosine-phosphatase